MLKILSLGAGVQSTTLALMAIEGHLEEIDATPDHMIFADTGDEPDAVYKHFDWLVNKIDGRIPIHIVTIGNIVDDCVDNLWPKGLKPAPHTALPPFFTKNVDETQGKLWRKCTSEYKLVPIKKKVRELLGFEKGEHIGKEVIVQELLGISLDEVQRMKPSRDAWSEIRWPLIEMNMTRHDCFVWCEKNGYSAPPRSACRICPFRSDSEWREMKLNAPKDFEKACRFDEKMREDESKRAPGVDGHVYLHKSLQPLRDIDFSNDFDNGQLGLWGGECEGICGI